MVYTIIKRLFNVRKLGKREALNQYFCQKGIVITRIKRLFILQMREFKCHAFDKSSSQHRKKPQYVDFANTALKQG